MLVAAQLSEGGTPIRGRVVSGAPSDPPQRWHDRQVVVHIDGSVDDLGPSARLAVEQSFRTWLEAPVQLPTIRFEAVSRIPRPTKPDGINSVSVSPIEIEGHERDLAVTVAFAESGSGRIVEADILLNSAYDFRVFPPVANVASTVDRRPAGAPLPPASRSPGGGGLPGVLTHRSLAQEGEAGLWEENGGGGYFGLPEAVDSSRQPPLTENGGECQGGGADAVHLAPSCNGDSRRGLACGYAYDLENVMAHEVGHFLGLGEDTGDGWVTMFHCTSACETHKRSLTQADIGRLTDRYADGFLELDTISDPVRCTLPALGQPLSPAFAPWLFGCLGVVVLAARRRAASGASTRSSAKERT